MTRRKRRLPTKRNILWMLREGWELGYTPAGDLFTRASAWMQKCLNHNGESMSCHLSSFRALRESGEITLLPRQAGDPFWLHRYGLSTPGLTTPKPL